MDTENVVSVPAPKALLKAPKAPPKPRVRARKPTAAQVAATVAAMAACFEADAVCTDAPAVAPATVAAEGKPDKAAVLAQARRQIAEKNYTQRVQELAAWAGEPHDGSEEARTRAAQRVEQWRHAAENPELYIEAHVARQVWQNTPAL